MVLLLRLPIRFLFLLFLAFSVFFSLFCLLLITNGNGILPIGHFADRTNNEHNNKYSFGDIRRTGDFCVLYNFTVAQLLREENQRRNSTHSGLWITLAVHSSLHYIHKIREQASHWDGFISVAVLVRPGEQSVLPHLLSLWHCSPTVRSRVSIHLVWRRAPFQPTDSCGLLSADQSLPQEFPCSDQSIYMQSLSGALSWPPLRYPINTLRNIARLGAAPMSWAHLVADVENVFSTNFTAMALKAVARDEKIAYVIRRFEVEDEVRELQPKIDVQHLKDLIQRKMAFPFHSHHFSVGHHIPGIDKWFNQSLSNSREATDMGPISFMSAAFEPQLIMSANAPLHFEDVPVRLYDHQVLIIELCHAGFQLRLLSNVFNLHRGVRRSLAEEEKVMKGIAARQSWKLIKQFRRHLEDKYGDGQQRRRRCPTFWRTDQTDKQK